MTLTTMMRKNAMKKYTKLVLIVMLINVLFIVASTARSAATTQLEKRVVRAGNRDYVLSYQVHLYGERHNAQFSDLRITSSGVPDLVLAYPAREKDEEELGDEDDKGTTLAESLQKFNQVKSDFFLVVPVSKADSLLIFFGWGYAGDPAVMWAISLTGNGAKVVFRQPAFLESVTAMGDPDRFRLILQKTLGECRCDTPPICTYEPHFSYQFRDGALVLNKEESEPARSQNLYTVKLKDKTITLPESDAMRYCSKEK
jgi:hypothetical protein